MAAGSPKGRLVLVVDPDLGFADALSALLPGDRVVGARGMDEAAAIADAGRVDVAIVGPSFGSEEGVESAAALRGADPALLSVLVADVPTNRVLRAALRAGFTDVIDAPVTTRKLAEVLRRTDALDEARSVPVVFEIDPQQAASRHEHVEAAADQPAPAIEEPEETEAETISVGSSAEGPIDQYFAFTNAPGAAEAPNADVPIEAAEAEPPLAQPAAAEPETVAPMATEPAPAEPAPVEEPPFPAIPDEGAEPAADEPFADESPRAPMLPEREDLLPEPEAVPVEDVPFAPPAPPPFPPGIGAPDEPAATPPMPSSPPPLSGDPATAPFPEPDPEDVPPSRKRPGAGRLITVMAGKGGSGKTITATNLATALTESTGEDKVVIVDADLQFGDVALMLQVDPTRTIADVAATLDDITEERLDSLLLRHDSGLRVLPAPPIPAGADRIGPKDVLRILQMLRGMFSHIVVDTPPIFDDGLITLLEHSDDVLLVVDMDLPSVKNAKIALDTLRAIGFDLTKVQIIVNRANSKARLDLGELERALGKEVGECIPSDRLIPQSVNEGVPAVAFSPRSRVAKAFHALAGQYL